ncbi:MAG: hypothetical protein BWY63_03094 [Chloroflexi bacterium ADurb.Bin360]|nr:MAG: hypothetical protein BWY63_03094 [Chloroflexi bacterium ADurb.Bin360]
MGVCGGTLSPALNGAAMGASGATPSELEETQEAAVR